MKSILKQIFAVILIISLIAVVGLTLFFAITGNEYFWGMMVLMFFYPIFLWAISFVYKWSKNNKDTDK